MNDMNFEGRDDGAEVPNTLTTIMEQAFRQMQEQVIAKKQDDPDFNITPEDMAKIERVFHTFWSGGAMVAIDAMNKVAGMAFEFCREHGFPEDAVPEIVDNQLRRYMRDMWEQHGIQVGIIDIDKVGRH